MLSFWKLRCHLASPITSPSTITTCDGRNFVGWPRGEVVEELHKRLWEAIPYVPLGQFKQPFPWRKNVTGLLETGILVFWYTEKT